MMESLGVAAGRGLGAKTSTGSYAVVRFITQRKARTIIEPTRMERENVEIDTVCAMLYLITNKI